MKTVFGWKVVYYIGNGVGGYSIDTSDYFYTSRAKASAELSAKVSEMRNSTRYDYKITDHMTFEKEVK